MEDLVRDTEGIAEKLEDYEDCQKEVIKLKQTIERITPVLKRGCFGFRRRKSTLVEPAEAAQRV